MENLYVQGFCGIIFVILAIVISGVVLAERIDKLKSYHNVWTGMPEDEMLKIMGSGYTKTTARGRVKYVWKVAVPGIKVNYKRAWKVTIFTKDDLVNEIKSFNI